MTQASTAIVIGAGIGGIATAAHLAQRGIKVTVFEKNHRPGGRCDHFERDGHYFDTGPTLFVMPLIFEREFAALGASAQECLNLQRVDPTYHLVFDDGSGLALSSDMKAMYEQLEAIETGSFMGFMRYLEEGDRHYRLAMSNLLEQDFRRPIDLFAPSNLPLLFRLKLLVKHYRNMSSYFKSPRLKSAFTFQDVYMGLSPFEAPATFSMMPYTELVHGVWYPEGGMYRVVEALMDIACAAGVQFELGAAVDQIVVNGKTARGVVLEDGRRFEADAVIANADLPYVYENLLPDKRDAKRLSHKRFSCSVISFFWGVDKTYPQLNAHTLFLADDYRQNFDDIIDHLTLPHNPSLYVHAPSRLNPAAAPVGQDTLIGIVPVGHIDEDHEQDWQSLRDQAREAVCKRLRLLGVTDLDEHIKFEVNYTPLSWRKRYNLMKGSTHGLAHMLSQLGYFRPRNRHRRYHNLFFVGASTHPGTGIPTSLVSARLVASRVLEGLR